MIEFVYRLRTFFHRDKSQYTKRMPRGYITTAQAAERLGITRHAIIALIRRGSLPADKFGSAWIIKEKDLEKVRIRKVGRPRKHLTK